jgi:peptidoglycan/LPS O-acetylase OafA/YrhL
MTRGLSLYLDLLRLLAAVEVLAYHLSGFPFGFERTALTAFGHQAVTIFFVLSGFVIRHAAGSSDVNVAGYAVSRITRVYSVALPCLLLTLLFDTIGRSFAPSLYAGLITDGSQFLRLAIGAAMLNEAWVAVQMLSNTPYWSISYEFWYYVLFAALFYLRGRQRWLWAAGAALIAGPRIMLLFPIWVLGWGAYRERFSGRFPTWLSWLLFLQPALILWLYTIFHWNRIDRAILEPLLGYDGWRNGLAWSRFLFSDTLLGMSVALHLVGAKGLDGVLLKALGWIERPIRSLAGQSFTLYLLHQPAMLFVGALFSGFALGGLRAWAVTAGTLLIISFVARFTESQRQRFKPLVKTAVTEIAMRLPRFIRAQGTPA